jgi:hypothetical protein
MKKLLLVLVLGGALLFPIVGLADTEGTADAALTLEAVINVNVIDELTDISLDQPALDALAVYGGSPTAPIFGTFGGTFTIQLVALTNFKAEISWAYAITNTTNPPAGADLPVDRDSILYLLDDTGTEIDYLPYSSVYTLTDFLGANNTPGEEYEYGLKVNLDNLGDRKSGDVITFTLTVTITDITV